MATDIIRNDLRITGATHVVGALTGDTASITNAMCSTTMELARSKLAQESLQPFTVPLQDLRVHDAITSFLPSAAAADDLGFDTGTFGSECAHVTAGDVKTTSSTRYARTLIYMPAEYDEAETLVVRVRAGMLTTVADGSCTVDVEAYRSDGDTTLSADLCTTAAQSCNSLSFADFDFTITEATFLKGDTLDVRISVIYVDSATATVVEPVITEVQLCCDVRG